MSARRVVQEGSAVARRRARNVLLAARGRPVPAPPPDPNPLQTYFDDYDGRQLHEWSHYFPIFHRHLAPFRERPVTVVAFGVHHGGPLRMWRDYLGAPARIVGVDGNPACADVADGHAEVVIGDQQDRDFLRGLARRLGAVDVVLDDGRHTMDAQISTFEKFWPHVRDGGVHLVQATHTSYRTSFGGGYRRPGTFVEYVKDLVDRQHAWHSRTDELVVDDYTRSIGGLHVYDSVIVLDKATVPRPEHHRAGYPSF